MPSGNTARSECYATNRPVSGWALAGCKPGNGWRGHASPIALPRKACNARCGPKTAQNSAPKQCAATSLGGSLIPCLNVKLVAAGHLYLLNLLGAKKLIAPFCALPTGSTICHETSVSDGEAKATLSKLQSSQSKSRPCSPTITPCRFTSATSQQEAACTLQTPGETTTSPFMTWGIALVQWLTVTP